MKRILLIVSFSIIGILSVAQDSTVVNPKLGSPDQVDNRSELDKLTLKTALDLGFADPVFQFRDTLHKKTGFNFNLDYASLYYGSTSKYGSNSAGSGLFRFYGAWELVGRKSGNSGALIYKLEHRHSYGDLPVSSLGFDNGYAGLVGPPFNDSKFRVQNLYWRQRIAKGKFAFVSGFLDVTDFLDVYGLASPWMHFNNLVFSTGSAAIGLPNDGYLGAAVGGWLSNRVYMMAGFGDQNSDPTDVFAGFDSFFNRNEYFKHVEIGLTSSKDYMFLDNLHFVLWHRDETKATQSGEGWGMNLSYTKYINRKLMPYVRLAYTDRGGSLLEKSGSIGFGYQPVQYSHLLGFGFNAGQVNNDTYGLTNDEIQYTFELFTRFQLSSRVAITPDVQYIINPALNPVDNSLLWFGLRARANI